LACTGCKEKHKLAQDAQRKLYAQITALLSECAGELKDTKPALTKRIVAMCGEINRAGIIAGNVRHRH
jgi:hypothetical protein